MCFFNTQYQLLEMVTSPSWKHIPEMKYKSDNFFPNRTQLEIEVISVKCFNDFPIH